MNKQTLFNIVISLIVAGILLTLIGVRSNYIKLQQQVLIMSKQSQQIAQALENNVAIDKSQQSNLESITRALEGLVKVLE